EKGGLVVAMGNGFHFFDPASKQFTSIVDTKVHTTRTRMNDGKTDRQGRFWSGSMFESQTEPPQAIGSLCRLDGDLSCHRIIEGVTCSNGLAWSPDSQTMYFSDSATPYVWKWDFHASRGEV